MENLEYQSRVLALKFWFKHHIDLFGLKSDEYWECGWGVCAEREREVGCSFFTRLVVIRLCTDIQQR